MTALYGQMDNSGSSIGRDEAISAILKSITTINIFVLDAGKEQEIKDFFNTVIK